MSFIPPPEDTVSLVHAQFGHEVRVQTVLHIGSGFFDKKDDTTVRNTPLRFCYVNRNILIDLWSAPLSVPEFTLRAYDTSATILCIEDADLVLFPYKIQRVVNIISAVVATKPDRSEEVAKFALQNSLPLFQCEFALYWCIHYLLCR